MRTLIVGDVHGCLNEFQELVAKFGLIAGVDRVFQVGDAINKGPDSLGVIRWMDEAGFSAVMGNHEAKLLDIWKKDESVRSEKEKRTLDRLVDPELIVRKVQNWPYWRKIETSVGDLTIVHAGLEPGLQDLNAMNPRCLLSIRTWDGVGDHLDQSGDPAWYDLVVWPNPVVFGHWALQGLLQKPGFIGLDSGCVYGGQLSGWCPEENRFYQVESKQARTSFYGQK